MNDFEGFREKFRIEELKVFETEHWVWSVRPVQGTLGSGILSLRRASEAFSEISDKESMDMRNILYPIERTLKTVWSFQRINYLMLMMVDYQVHFHVFPRYDKEIVFNSRIWMDDDWPKPPTVTGNTTEESMLQSIKRCLIENLEY